MAATLKGRLGICHSICEWGLDGRPEEGKERSCNSCDLQVTSAAALYTAVTEERRADTMANMANCLPAREDPFGAKS